MNLAAPLVGKLLRHVAEPPIPTMPTRAAEGTLWMRNGAKTVTRPQSNGPVFTGSSASGTGRTQDSLLFENTISRGVRPRL